VSDGGGGVAGWRAGVGPTLPTEHNAATSPERVSDVSNVCAAGSRAGRAEVVVVMVKVVTAGWGYPPARTTWQRSMQAPVRWVCEVAQRHPATLVVEHGEEGWKLKRQASQKRAAWKRYDAS
jgi:hypothetical protein